MCPAGRVRFRLGPRPPLTASPMADGFAALSPALQRDQLRAADIWGITAVSWDGTTDTLLIGAKHHEAKMDVGNIPYGGASTVGSSLALWWSFFTGKLQAVDRDVLVTHAPGRVWMTYKD